MRISDMLSAVASWLENADNDALLLAEQDEETLKIVAEHCIEAATAIKVIADKIEEIEPKEESKITSESIETLASIASAFDSSGDDELKKQASVIDELLLTIAAPPNAIENKRAVEEKRIQSLKDKYKQPRQELEDKNKISESQKDIAKSQYTKNYRIMEAPLQTRYCPDHPGTQMTRVAEGAFQCELDKKTYNYEIGYDLSDGSHVPGGSVNNQSSHINDYSHSMFDSREQRLLTNQP